MAEAEKVSPGVVTHRVVLLKIVRGIDERFIRIIDPLPIVDPLSISGRDIEASVSVPDYRLDRTML